MTGKSPVVVAVHGQPTPAPAAGAGYDEEPGDELAQPQPPGSSCGLTYVSVSALLSGQKPAKLTAARLAEITWDFENCTQRPHRAAIYELGADRHAPFNFSDMAPGTPTREMRPQ